MSHFYRYLALALALGASPLFDARANSPRAAEDGNARGQESRVVSQAKRLAALLRQGDRAERRLNKIALNRTVLALVKIEPEHPGTLYYQALASVLGQDDEVALGRFKKLSLSAHKDAPVFRVRARRAKSFRHLLVQKDFRKFVGIDADPARPLTAYERLMGLGGLWVEAGVPCESPRIELDLGSDNDRFALTLASRCQGAEDKTRFRGTWTWKSKSELLMTFPNGELGSEALTCRLSTCDTKSDEDCLGCAPDPELKFRLRPKRR